MVTHKPELLNLSLQVCIGKACGGFANVFLGKRPGEKCALAVRVVPLDHTKISLAALEREVSLTRSLNHKNILAVVEVFVHQTSLCVVNPLMDFGSVTDLIHAKFVFGLSESAISLIAADVLEAINYLHCRDIIHRSIRCSHILVSSDGGVCLSGFRYATSIMQNGKRALKLHQFSPQLKSNLLWLAPEVLQQNMNGYNLKSDIYSFGVSICEMANGFPPFADMEHMQMLLEKLRGTTPRLLDATTLGPVSAENVTHHGLGHEQRSRKFSESFHSFAESCLKPNQNLRHCAKGLLSHAFLKQNKKSGQSLKQLLAPLRPISYSEKYKHGSSQKQANATDNNNSFQQTLFDWNF